MRSLRSKVSRTGGLTGEFRSAAAYSLNCGHLDSDNSKIAELHRGNLPDYRGHLGLNPFLNNPAISPRGKCQTMGPFHALFALIILVLDIIAIVSVLGGTSSAGRKVLWVVVILFFPLIGVILYFLIGQSPRDA
jgi:hypothetical protein